jgi:hypothetical protein
MSVYPRNLSAFLNRLSGYNKTNVKLNVLGSTKATDGDTVQVDLPSNSIVDLSSLAWYIKLIYDDPTKATKHMVAPIQAESLIKRLAVEVNGQTLVNIQNYNVLFHMLLYMSATEDYQRQRLINQANMYNDSANGTAETIVAGATAGARTRYHVIDSWLGFLGTAKPQFIDTSLLGNVRITITLAGSEIMGGDDADVVRGYSLDEQYFSMDVISISDGIYDAMVDQRLASGAPIEIPFKNYFSFMGAGSGATMTQKLAFNVASQSIDRLWCTARKNDHGGMNTAISTTTGDEKVHSIVVANPTAFNFATCGGKHFQFQVNNTMYPNYLTDHPCKWFQLTKNALGEQGNMLSGSFPENVSHYRDYFFAFAQSLEHKTDGDERFVSGIDTRGASAQCYLNVDAGGPGTAVANETLVFAECTSSLKVYANKVLEVVQ